LKGKQRSENLERLQAAKNEAKDLEDQAQQKTADYNAKIKEYNQARRDSLFHPFIIFVYFLHVYFPCFSPPLPSSLTDEKRKGDRRALSIEQCAGSRHDKK
jgi:hypothetical protein